MIRALCYCILITLFAACTLISLLTHEGGVNVFSDVHAPDDLLGFVTFVPTVLIDFVQFLFSCVFWDFIPGLPATIQTPLVVLSLLPVVAVFIMDVLPPLVELVSKAVLGFLP